jgi:hypothetical protein
MKNRWVGLGILGILACSSSESTAPEPAPDGGTATPGTPMTVWVYAVARKAGDPATPLGGATVAFDPPDGGERVELTTEADGHATTNMDFTKGTAVVSATAPERIVLTALEVSPETVKNNPPNPFGKPNTDLVLLLGPNPKGVTSGSVEITGKLTGKAAPENVIGLASTGVFGFNYFPSDGYAARVPKGIPFSLVGFESGATDTSVPRTFDVASVRPFRIDHAALDANTTLDIDASQGTLATTTVHWKLELPGGDGGPLGGTSTAFANVLSFDSGVGTGFYRHVAPTADKNGFDIEELVTTADLAPEVTRTVAIIRTTDGAVALREMLGSAPDGTVFKDFIVPSAVAVTKQTRADAFAVDGVPTEAESVNVNLSSGPDLEWVVLGPFKKKPGGPIKLPAPPSTAVLPSTLTAQIVALADFASIPGRPPGALFAQKISASRPITVTK